MRRNKIQGCHPGLFLYEREFKISLCFEFWYPKSHKKTLYCLKTWYIHFYVMWHVFPCFLSFLMRLFAALGPDFETFPWFFSITYVDLLLELQSYFRVMNLCTFNTRCLGLPESCCFVCSNILICVSRSTQTTLKTSF